MDYIEPRHLSRISSYGGGFGQFVSLVTDGTVLSMSTYRHSDRILFFRIALAFGHPFMIDVHDCNVRLPSSGDPNALYMDELVRLSVILGRVVKTIYRFAFLFLASFYRKAHILT